MGLKADAVTAAVGKAKEGHFQAACTVVYEARHPTEMTAVVCNEVERTLRGEGGVQHPNQYFAESRKYYKDKEEGDAN